MLNDYPKTQDSEEDTDDNEFLHMVSDPQHKLINIIQRMEEIPVVKRKLEATKIKKLCIMVSPNSP